MIYGRNMWQEHLNAFTYDVYSHEQQELYAWMCMAGRYGTIEVPMAADTEVVGDWPEVGSSLDGISCMQTAIRLGVNRILIPADFHEEELERLEAALGLKAIALENYYLFWVE